MLYDRGACVLVLTLLCSFQSSAQWKRTNGPFDRTFGAMTSIVNHGSYQVVGTGSGIYRSSDTGQTWTRVVTGLTEDNITSLCSDGTILYAGTGYGQVFRSNDDGEVWIEASTGLPGSFSNSITALTIVDTVVFAGTYSSGVFRSTDQGASWTSSSSGIPSFGILSMLAQDSTLVLAHSFGGVVKSTNHGTSWQSASSGITTPITKLFTGDTNEIFAAAFPEGLYRSGNLGGNWTSVPGFPNTFIDAMVFSDGMYYAASGMTVYRSTDNGASWPDSTIVEPGSRGPRIEILAASAGRIFAGTEEDGIYVSTDSGEGWSPSNTGFTSHIDIRTFTHHGEFIFTGTENGHGAYRSGDGGESWTPVNNSIEDGPIWTMTTDGTYLYAAGEGLGVLRSSDHGNAWSRFDEGLGGDDVHSLLFKDEWLYAGTLSDGVYRSSDHGETWLAANNGIAQTWVWCLATSADYLFAGTDGAGILRSGDRGESWVEVNTGLTDDNVRTIAVVGTDLFIATLDGVFRSTDNGDNWSWRNAGMDGADVWSIVSIGELILAGTDGFGVFSSTDRGATWTPVNSGLANLRIFALFISGEHVIAGTIGNGIWHRRLTEIVAGPSMVLTASTISWPSTPVGCPGGEVTFFIDHSGGSPLPLTVTGISTDNPSFPTSSSIGSIYPPERLQVTTRFLPRDTGMLSGKITISHNGINNPDTVELSGFGSGSPDISMSVELNDGWRLISAPIRPLCTRSLPSFGYDPSLGYTRTDTITSRLGFWQNAAGPLFWAGGYIHQESVYVQKGWNLLGSISKSIPVDQITPSTDSLMVTGFYGYDGEAYFPTDSIHPGMGYWMKFRTDGYLIYDTASGGPQSNSHREPSRPRIRMDSLTITDALGRSQSLHIADSVENLDAYELPPIPPEGIFDARFESGRRAEAMRSGIPRTIAVQGVYPLTVHYDLFEKRVNLSGVEIAGRGSVIIAAPPVTIGEASTPTIPKQFGLDQNYPNPFNPTTHIRYTLPRSGFVHLAIYTVLGEEVTRLAQGFQPAGEYMVTWDASNVSNGIYFYRLSVGDFSTVKKMALIR